MSELTAADVVAPFDVVVVVPAVSLVSFSTEFKTLDDGATANFDLFKLKIEHSGDLDKLAVLL